MSHIAREGAVMYGSLLPWVKNKTDHIQPVVSHLNPNALQHTTYQIGPLEYEVFGEVDNFL